MIKINKIEPETVEAFDPQGNSLGWLNEYEFNDLRIQIMNEKAEGYYIKRGDDLAEINKDGRMSNWFCFNLLEEQMYKLLKF